MKQLVFEQTGSSSMYNCPMVPIYKTVLGQDSDGKEWLCQVSPVLQKHLMWNVDFDTNDEYLVDIQPDWDYDPEYEPSGYSTPFLRLEVLYCKEWMWDEMNKKYYHRKEVEYCDIGKTIEEFVNDHGIK